MNIRIDSVYSRSCHCSFLIVAEVIGFRQNATLLMPLYGERGLTKGQRVRHVTSSQKVPVGPTLLGRGVDGMGVACDEGAPISADTYYPLHRPAPDAVCRPRIDKPMSVGVRSINAFLTAGSGQRLGIFAGTGVGKSVLLGMMARYTAADVAVVALVGERGRGFRQLLHGLNPERILLSSMACGLGEAAIRRATNYAIEREVFGRPIGANQAISHPLAQAHMQLAAAKNLAMLAAWRYDNGLECGEQANTAKYLAAEASYFAADQALQTHGGLGYADEYHVGRYWREARLQRLAPVSQEMTCNYIAHNVLGLPRSY